MIILLVQGLRVDDVDLEEPMFRTIPPVTLSTTRPAEQSRPTPSSSTRSAGQARPIPSTTLRNTALRPVPSITNLRQSRPTSTTLRAQSMIPPSRPSTAQSRPILSNMRSALSTKAKPISVPVPAPVAEDLSHLMEDLPIPELSLDFGFDNCIL
jgi:hypothetical protein